jgi:hypothetical protein
MVVLNLNCTGTSSVSNVSSIANQPANVMTKEK